MLPATASGFNVAGVLRLHSCSILSCHCRRQLRFAIYCEAASSAAAAPGSWPMLSSACRAAACSAQRRSQPLPVPTTSPAYCTSTVYHLSCGEGGSWGSRDGESWLVQGDTFIADPQEASDPGFCAPAPPEWQPRAATSSQLQPHLQPAPELPLAGGCGAVPRLRPPLVGRQPAAARQAAGMKDRPLGRATQGARCNNNKDSFGSKIGRAHV